MEMYKFTVRRMIRAGNPKDNYWGISDYAKGYVLAENRVDAIDKLEIEYPTDSVNTYEITVERTDIIKL